MDREQVFGGLGRNFIRFSVEGTSHDGKRGATREMHAATLGYPLGSE